ncbi:MAG: dCTP deaminase [Methanomassiliicoccales archaeon]|nr:dCTP deaminase [Methanomassiliicoccales archaeon]
MGVHTIMCLVPDHEIESMLRDGSLVITNYSAEGLTPNGYDLRVAEARLEGGESVTYGTFLIPPGKLFFVSTVERVELPDDLAAQLWTRTSWLRKGLLMGLGKIDAGFHGTLTFSGLNASSAPVELPIGSRMVQMVLETMRSPVERTYAKRSGNYQGQQGITLKPADKH